VLNLSKKSQKHNNDINKYSWCDLLNGKPSPELFWIYPSCWYTLFDLRITFINAFLHGKTLKQSPRLMLCVAFGLLTLHINLLTCLHKSKLVALKDTIELVCNYLKLNHTQITHICFPSIFTSPSTAVQLLKQNICNCSWYLQIQTA